MNPNHALNKVFKGTEFQKKVWNYVKTIKKGYVMTYKQVLKLVTKILTQF